MRIRSVLPLMPMCLALAFGSNALADDFAIIDIGSAEVLSDAEMDAVTAGSISFSFVTATSFRGTTTLSLSQREVALNGSPTFDFADDFMPHGGCPNTTCGNSQLTGWGEGRPSPRGFELPPGQR